MCPHPFDLKIPELAYLFGLLQTDGHLSRTTRNRGRASIEIQVRDRSVLDQFKNLLPIYSSMRTRKRTTSFKQDAEFASWSLYDENLRTSLHTLGVPYGAKSRTVGLPKTEDFSRRDYFRGLVDGDGSLGITKRGFPFVSFCTVSPLLAEGYLAYVREITGKQKSSTPNKRDGAHNIAVFKEDAQKLATTLYKNCGIAISRKASKAAEISAWVRPTNMRRVTWERRSWNPREDQVVLDYPVDQAARILNRTPRSILVRACRIRKNQDVLQIRC